MRHPIDRWEPYDVDVSITGGPERVYDSNEAGPTPKILGFTNEPEIEPLLWEGDDS
ncbi:hypothetical protein [Nocardioides alcanivorans]|uniref:hypothetical protein n=1 Tax=Nocardioides alcanivorans TaxID=2897352 RepID=UPI001F1F0251|nr:hypothetical protein [Nocardioides alcanivorans]